MQMFEMPTPLPRDNANWNDLLARAEVAWRERRFHDALQLSDRAAVRGETARYHAAVMRGDVLMDVGDFGAALSTYDSVARLEVQDPSLDCARGVALFHLVRLAEAEYALRSAIRGRDDLAEAYYTLGLIAELRGTGDETEYFRVARRLDAERYPIAPSMSKGAFEGLVQQAIDALPLGMGKRLNDLPTVVVDVPNVADLRRSSPPTPPTSLALFVGRAELVGTPVKGADAPSVLLFKRNFERAYPDRERLVAEIARTVLLEASHVLGLRTLGLVN